MTSEVMTQKERDERRKCKKLTTSSYDWLRDSVNLRTMLMGLNKKDLRRFSEYFQNMIYSKIPCAVLNLDFSSVTISRECINDSNYSQSCIAIIIKNNYRCNTIYRDSFIKMHDISCELKAVSKLNIEKR